MKRLLIALAAIGGILMASNIAWDIFNGSPWGMNPVVQADGVGDSPPIP